MSGSDAVEFASHREVCPAGDVRRGKTTLISGCMFSGKTTLLLEALAEHRAEEVLAIRHRMDDRYRTDAIVSHNGRSYPARTIGCTQDLLRWRIGPTVKLIVIDEVHFLDESLLYMMDQIAQTGRHVTMAGLDLNSWGQPFPHMTRLAQAVDRSVCCTGICGRCGGVADHTQRLTPIVDGRLVGGSESYESRCATCWTPPPTASLGGTNAHSLRASSASDR